MAQIDVSEALEDPDYVDQLQYVRTQIVTGVNGRASKANPQTLDFVGSVQAGDGDALNRGGDAEYQTGSIAVITREPLTSGNDDFTADVVMWRGAQYTVSLVEDWGNYGEGYFRAQCDLKPLRGAAP